MAMLKDVARHAGVDVSTASKVLSGRAIRVADATRTRIESAARELNYTPNAVAGTSVKAPRSGGDGG